MAHEIVAPWAQPVPGSGPMTVDEFFQLPDEDGWRLELVDGVLVKMPSPGYQHGEIIGDLASELGHYVKSHRLGKILGAETGFLLSRPDDPDTVLGPDISFVRAEHVPARSAPDRKKYLRVPPDLAGEVASPDQYKPEMGAKARLYLSAGVRLVWVIWPASQTVDVWRSGSDVPVATLSVGDALDGLDVVLGFSYPLTDLFQ